MDHLRIDSSRLNVKLHESSFNCPVCYLEYDSKPKLPRTPKFLPCSHTLCDKCLKEIFQRDKNQAACPLDRTKLLDSSLRFSEETVEKSFKTNLFAIDIIDQISSQKENIEYKNCETHDKMKKFICFTDKAAICEDCKKNHIAHKIMLIQDLQPYLNERRKDLETMKNSLKQSAQKASRFLEENKQPKVEELVQKKLQDLKLTLNELAQEEINQQYENEKASIALKSEEIERAINKEIEKFKKPAYDNELIEAFENSEIMQPYLFDQEKIKFTCENISNKVFQRLDRMKLSDKPDFEEFSFFDYLEFVYDFNLDLKITSASGAIHEINDRIKTNYTQQKFLGYRNCSSINIDFTYVKLSNKFLYALQSVFTKLVEFGAKPECIKLDLSHKDFDDNDALELFSSEFWSIKHIIFLEISLKECIISDIAIIQGLSHTIKRMDSLQSLILNLEKSKISDQGIQNLSEALGTSSLKIRQFELDVSKTNITYEGVRYLSKNLVPILKHVAKLKLVFNTTKIGNLGIQEIAQMFEYLESIKSFELSVFDASITDVGMILLISQMAKFQKNIEKILNFMLSLSSNPGIRDETAIYLADNLLPIMCKLDVLKLYLRKTSLTDEGVKKLSKALENVGKNLSNFEIVLSNNNLTDSCFESLSAAFAKFQNLRSFELSLFGVPITSNSFSKLCEKMNGNSLHHITHLHLNLSCTKINDEGIITLGNTVLSHLINLESFELSLRDTKVTDASVFNLIKEIKPRKLRSFILVLSNTKVKGHNLIGLGKIFMQSKFLQTLELNFRFTDIHDGIIYSICNSLFEIAPNLKTFRFNISHTKATEMSILKLCELITQMVNVEELELELCSVSLKEFNICKLFLVIPENIKKIKILKLNLASIPLNNSDIVIFTAIIATYAKKLKTLELNLEHTKVTEQATNLLKNMKTIQSLKIIL